MIDRVLRLGFLLFWDLLLDDSIQQFFLKGGGYEEADNR
jgi:hypothetical protein